MFQVRICLDKQLNLIDCTSNPIEVCSPNEAINFYPEMPHKKMLKLEASPCKFKMRRNEVNF